MGSKQTARRQEAVKSGLSMLKEIYDPSVVLYDEREKNLRRRDGYARYNMVSEQAVNMISSRKISMSKKPSNMWFKKRESRSSQKNTSQALYSNADRSRSPSPDTDFEVINPNKGNQ